MTPTQTSQCHCGQIKLTFSTENQFSFACHCDTCQSLVSGGRLFGFAIPKENLTITGKPKNYTYAGGSKDITLSFCSTCSTQLYAMPQSLPDKVVIRANMLNTPKSFTTDNILFAEDACAFDAQQA